jgi:choline dehydrogenase
VVHCTSLILTWYLNRDALETAWVSKGRALISDVYSGVQKGLFKCVSSIHMGLRSTAAVFIEGKENVKLVSSIISKKILFNGENKAVRVVRRRP